MALLLADLRMLANLPASPAGRRALFGTLVGLLLLGTMSWWIAAEVALRPRLLAFVHDQSQGDSLRGLLGAGLMPCPVAATWLGLALAQRQLFESGELGLWRAAPLPPWRPALQILLRAGFVALCWALALSGPFVVTMLQRAAAPPLAYALLPLVLLVGSLPLLASLLAAQLVLVRFCSGRWLRLILALLAAIASVGFSTWLLLGLFQNPGARMSALAATAASPDRLPWTIDVGAALLAAAARGELAVAPLLGGVGWLLGSVAGFALLANLHPTALERHESAGKPLLRFWRSRWHGSPARLLRKKEFAQVLQQPGALLSFLVFGFLVFALARQRVFTGAILGDPRLPDDLASYGAMLALWFLAVMLVLYAHMGRLALWDGAQWALYMGAPTPPSALVRGKLAAVGTFLLWPLLLVAVIGSQQFEAAPVAVWAFVGTALGGTATALGVLAAIGTWPRLMRPDEGGQIVQGGRTFLAAMALVLAFEFAVAPGVFGWLYLLDRLRVATPSQAELVGAAPWVVGAALLYGTVVLLLGYLVACRNYRRLLAPRP